VGSRRSSPAASGSASRQEEAHQGYDLSALGRQIILRYAWLEAVVMGQFVYVLVARFFFSLESSVAFASAT